MSIKLAVGTSNTPLVQRLGIKIDCPHQTQSSCFHPHCLAKKTLGFFLQLLSGMLTDKHCDGAGWCPGWTVCLWGIWQRKGVLVCVLPWAGLCACHAPSPIGAMDCLLVAIWGLWSLPSTNMLVAGMGHLGLRFLPTVLKNMLVAKCGFVLLPTARSPTTEKHACGQSVDSGSR